MNNSENKKSLILMLIFIIMAPILFGIIELYKGIKNYNKSFKESDDVSESEIDDEEIIEKFDEQDAIKLLINSLGIEEKETGYKYFYEYLFIIESEDGIEYFAIQRRKLVVDVMEVIDYLFVSRDGTKMYYGTFVEEELVLEREINRDESFEEQDD
jgi:hypothetical protein